MARRKTAAQADIKPWLSAKPDCKEGRFIQLGNTLLLSKVFQALNPSTQMLYISLAMESGGKRDVILSRSNAKKYGIAASTYSRAIKELSETGFIKVDLKRGRYEANRFEFISDWKNGNPAPK